MAKLISLTGKSAEAGIKGFFEAKKIPSQEVRKKVVNCLPKEGEITVLDGKNTVSIYFLEEGIMKVFYIYRKDSVKKTKQFLRNRFPKKFTKEKRRAEKNYAF